MSRTIPRAYVTAAWNKNPVVAKEDAKKYCQELVRQGVRLKSKYIRFPFVSIWSTLA